jgi:hypothetical protein
MESLPEISMGVWVTMELFKSGLLGGELQAVPVSNDDEDTIYDDDDNGGVVDDEEDFSPLLDLTMPDDYSEECWVLINIAYSYDLLRSARISTPYFKDMDRWKYDLEFYTRSLDNRQWRSLFRFPKSEIRTITTYLKIPEIVTTEDRHKCYGHVTFLMLLYKYARPRTLGEMEMLFRIDKRR